MPVFGVLSDRDRGRGYMVTAMLIVMVARLFTGMSLAAWRAYPRAGFACLGWRLNQSKPAVIVGYTSMAAGTLSHLQTNPH